MRSLRNPPPETCHRGGNPAIQQGEQRHTLTLRVKLLRHLEGDDAAHRPSAKKVRPRRLHGLHGLDVVGCHVFDPRVGVLPVFQAPRLQAIAGLIRTEELRQMNVGEYMPTCRMDQEERPSAATGLNGHQ